MTDRQEWITTGEAARMLGVRSINTIKRLIRDGRLTAIRPGGHYRVARQDVERLGSSPVTTRTRPDPMLLLQSTWLEEWAALHRVRRIWLFGSAARGEMRADSDVDVAIEFRDDARGGLFELVAMQDELTERVGRPVDLGTLSSMRPYVRRNAERDLVLIHEG
ncbi:MAG: nucleotidyltransferase domain-containing protein [Candidatus Limnocylindria bacterium]